VTDPTVIGLAVHLETHAYRSPFGEYLEPFLGAPGTAESLVVEIELSDGRRGAGEATLLASWSGEWPAAARLLLDRVVRGAIVGLPAREAAAAARAALAANGYLLWAVDAAVIDALEPLALHAPLPVRGLVGPFGPETSAALAAEQLAGGFERIKVKLSGTIADDDARLRAVRDAVPGAVLVVDANEAIPYDDLPAYAVLFRETGVAGVEQPCARSVVREHGLPAADGWLWIADESIWGHEDALSLRSGPWDAWTVHPGKSRGEDELRRVAEIADERGIAIVVGSNLHFGPGVPALCRVASALPASTESASLGHDIPAPVVYESWAHPQVQVAAGSLGPAEWNPRSAIAV
jgi:L-alanine-DL-glutamate epimerase-like enolase superfamily enzyme